MNQKFKVILGYIAIEGHPVKKKKKKKSILVVKLAGHEDQSKASTTRLSDLHEASPVCRLLGFEQPRAETFIRVRCSAGFTCGYPFV